MDVVLVVLFAFFVIYLVESFFRVFEKYSELEESFHHQTTSTECYDEREFFESFFIDHGVPIDGSIWRVPEGCRIEIDMGSRSCRLGPGDRLAAKVDSLAVYKNVTLSDKKRERNDRYIDWDAVDSIYISRPLNASELLDGDGEHAGFEWSPDLLHDEEPLCKCGGCEDSTEVEEAILSGLKPEGMTSLKRAMYTSASEQVEPVIPEYEGDPRMARWHQFYDDGVKCPSAGFETIHGHWVVNTYQLWRFLFGHASAIRSMCIDAFGAEVQFWTEDFDKVEDFEAWMRGRDFVLDIHVVLDDREVSGSMHTMYTSFCRIHSEKEARARRDIFKRVVSRASEKQGSAGSKLPEYEAKTIQDNPKDKWIVNSHDLWMFLFGGTSSFGSWIHRTDGPFDHMEFSDVDEFKEWVEDKDVYISEIDVSSLDIKHLTQFAHDHGRDEARRREMLFDSVHDKTLDCQWTVSTWGLWRFLFETIDTLVVEGTDEVGDRVFYSPDEFEEWMVGKRFALDISYEEKQRGLGLDGQMYEMKRDFTEKLGEDEADRRTSIFERVIAQVPRTVLPSTESDGDKDVPDLKPDFKKCTICDKPAQKNSSYCSDHCAGPVEPVAVVMPTKCEVDKVDAPKTSTECALKKEVCRECINEVVYGQAWNFADEANWGEGTVACPRSHAIDSLDKPKGFTGVSTSSLPSYCPYASEHAFTECEGDDVQ